MVKLHMSPVFVGSHVTLGPAPWFRLVGNQLYQGSGGDPVGSLEDHQWMVHGRRFTVMQADPSSSLHFETAIGQASPPEGPFDELYLVDGAIYGDRRLIAQFDEHNATWRSARTLEPWPVVVVTSRSLAAPERVSAFTTAAR